MHQERLVAVMVGSERPGRCRYCGHAIVWAVTASRPGKPSRTLPFTAPRPLALHTGVNPATGVRFESWPTAALHMVTCRKPQRPTHQEAHA